MGFDKENQMARLISEIQPHEVRAYEQFCTAHNVIIHDGSAEAIENANFVHNYFVNTWGEMITPETLAQAFPVIKPHLKLKSPAYLEAERLAQGYPDAQALAAWFDKQQTLVKDGDLGYKNFSELIQELEGRPATQANIDSAIASIQYATEGGTVEKYSTRTRRPLAYAQRQTDRPKSFHQQTDDGTNPFSTKGLTLQGDGTYGKSPADYAREARAAAEKNNPQPTVREQLSAVEKEYKKMAEELLRYGTHGQQNQIRQAFDKALQSGADWRRVFEACNRIVNQYRRSY
jgi:hypothetical protein